MLDPLALNAAENHDKLPWVTEVSPTSHVEALLRRHRPALRAFVARRAGDLVDPDDLVQQAAVRALAHADRLRDPARGRAWIFRIVRNLVADELRRKGPIHVPIDAALGSEDPELEPGQVCRCALALVDTLKPEYATILRRVDVDGVSATVLAAELGVTANNAMVRLHRARRALRERVAARCGTDSLRACLDCTCDERGCCGPSAGRSACV